MMPFRNILSQFCYWLKIPFFSVSNRTLYKQYKSVSTVRNCTLNHSGNLCKSSSLLSHGRIEDVRVARHYNVTSQANEDELTSANTKDDILASPEKMSWLFVPNSKRSTVCSVLEPYLDFEEQFSCMDTLAENVKYRGLGHKFTDDKLTAMKQGWNEFKSVADLREDSKRNVKILQSEIKKLQKENTPVPSQKTEQLKMLRNRVKANSLQRFEKELIPFLLQLPNCLHQSTPLTEDDMLLSVGTSPNFQFNAKTHAELGSISNGIVFTNDVRGSFYLYGKLSCLELALEEYLVNFFDEMGFTQHSNPDLVKGVTVEGCGYDIHDPSKTLKTIYNQQVEDHAPLFLFGGCSLPSFTTYFAKRIVGKSTKFLPQKLFAAGRLYRPLQSNFSQSNIFDSMQSSAVSAFVAFDKEFSSETEIIEELLSLLVSRYKNLGLHFRLVRKCAKNLEIHESAAYSIEMFSTTAPAAGDSQYVEIARMSNIGDFISKRLLMLHTTSNSGSEKTNNPSLDFLNVIYVKVMDISKFIAVLIENTQTQDGNYTVPEALKDIMSDYEY